ncbi:MAG: hypothetical protein N3I86_02660, partial [Verrucomicrobiae bacterium]|nr:hypothetical protein [Verrucomicrobiae bacterium]
LGFAVLLALIPFMASSGPEPSWEAALVLWLAVGIAADVGFGVWAHHKLLTEFRARAAERYAPRPPWWRRWRGAEAASAPASHAG